MRLVDKLLLRALIGQLIGVTVGVSRFFLVERHFPTLTVYPAIFRFDDLLLLDVGRGLEGEGLGGDLEGGEVDDRVVPLRQQVLMRNLVEIPDALLEDVGSGILELGDDLGVGVLECIEQVALGIYLALPPVFH